MRCLTYFARVLGICALCLGAVAFMGCSGSGNSAASTITPGDGSAGSTGGTDGTTSSTTTGFTAVIPAPTFPTNQDFAIAKCKPNDENGYEMTSIRPGHDDDDALATLAPFSICAGPGRIIAASGDEELAVCLHDNRGSGIELTTLNKPKKDCTSPLGTASDFSAVRSLLPIIFPEGRNCIGLSEYSDLDLGQFCGSLTNPLFNTRIKGLRLLFDVKSCLGEPIWTLPTNIAFTSKMANGKSVINGSKLVLTWNPSKGSIPPHGRAYVIATFTFFNNGRFLFCIRKPVPICDNVATFTADNTDCSDPTIYFDKVDISFDLTNYVPFENDAPADVI